MRWVLDRIGRSRRASDARPPGSGRYALEDYLLLVLLAAMAAIAAGSVANRYLLPSIRLAYIDQLLPDLFIWLSILGAASAMRERGHLGMLAIVRRLRRPLRVAAGWLTALCGLGFFGVLAWKGLDLALLQFRQGNRAPFGYPAWVIGLAIPAGSVLAIVRILQAAISSPDPAEGQP